MKIHYPLYQIYRPTNLEYMWQKVHQNAGHERLIHGPLTRYVKLQVAHAPGMPGTFSPATDFKGNRKLAIPACITARAWRTCRDACRDRLPAVTGKTFPAFPAHAHPQFCVSGKRPMISNAIKTSRRNAWNLEGLGAETSRKVIQYKAEIT